MVCRSRKRLECMGDWNVEIEMELDSGRREIEGEKVREKERQRDTEN